MNRYNKQFFNVLVFIFLYAAPAYAITPIDQAPCLQHIQFKVGAGIYDITGPVAEQGMMGYGLLEQKTKGLYQRLWARAFVIESPCNGKRVVFVEADLGQLFLGIKQEVVRILKQKYDGLYDHDNVMLAASHQHSGPGGYSTYAFYNLSTLGFDRKNFNTIVDGIVRAIARAHDNMASAYIDIAYSDLPMLGINRSPSAYVKNPKNERDKYVSNMDTQVVQLKFVRTTGEPIGVINWFALHGTSMGNQNRLVHGDNKGYAAYLLEKDFESTYDSQSFVAAFVQSNSGDISPNKLGRPGGSGLQGIQDVENAGKPQYEKAKELFYASGTQLHGAVDYRHTFVAMDDVAIDPKFTDGTSHTTSPAAIGISMLAGTQDGEGFGKQGITCNNVTDIFPNIACALVTKPQQGIKPIAIETGSKKPYPWTPQILPVQIFIVGNIALVGVPFELTTMAGRRLREMVANKLASVGIMDVILTTLANGYAGYVTTYEEYQVQRYEGASTHFGPWTLAALQQEYDKLAQAFLDNTSVPRGPMPPDLARIVHLNLQTGVVFDDKPLFKSFGDIKQNVRSIYKPGDRVEAVFWGAHPKNNYRIQDTFLKVQRKENGTWVTIRTDNDWDTEYHWDREGIAYSLVTIAWRIPKNIIPGIYRIVHYGDWKSGLDHNIRSYVGYSSEFKIN